MYRKISHVLENWLNKKEKKPLIIDGARQIGKTFIIDEFCKNKAKNYIKFDFVRNKKQQLDANVEDFDTLKDTLQLKYNFKFDDEDTIVFFDEIQECPYLIQNLKYLKIEYPDARIICSGSLLDVRYKSMNISFPVGYVETITMRPMDFEEFLYATGNERYISLIEESYNKNSSLTNSIHQELLKLYHIYLSLGGMPEILKNYIDNGSDLTKLDFNIINSIINIYREDMIKYAKNPTEAVRIQRIYDNIVPQLSKENPKFQYASLDKFDNRKSSYVSPLDWLITSEIITACYQVTKPDFPLRAYVDDTSYKIYVNDVGILGNLADINVSYTAFDGDYSFKGKLAENYCLQQLLVNDINVYYYSEKNKSNKSMEIDFLFQCSDGVIPIEVKAEKDTQSKILKSYIERFKPKYAIRVSSRNFGFENNIKSVPLYAVFCIKKY